jgi:multiple sugar transport system permease protein
VTAYIFILPAFLIIGTFGLFPIGFAVYVSLHRWRIVPGDYRGLANYVKAIDNLTYVVAFWLVVLFAVLAVRGVLQARRTANEHGDRWWLWALPALVTAGGMVQFVRFCVLLLPEVLDIGEQVKGLERTRELFLGLLVEAWRTPAVQAALRSSLLILVVGFGLALWMHRSVTRRPRDTGYYASFILAFLLAMASLVLGWLTWSEIQAAYAEALAEGAQLEIWSQIVTISAGFVLLLLAWRMWNSASHRPSMAATLFRLGAAVALTIGAWVLISELPRVIAAGDENWWKGLQVTVYYSLGTVPIQLVISLVLATFLFQNIRGKGFFRLIYFLPYITPPVAAAAVFRVLFSGRPTAPINNVLRLFGAKSLLWLDEPAGVFQMVLGSGITLPEWAVGPSLALVVIIIYNIWSYVGYDTVIFLAGLGGIPGELYEAASIDGASSISQFRHITLPLLSPTTYFLTLIAVIGTFKAFNHVWVLRSGAALGTTDTASVAIFQEFFRNTRYGYAASLALVLLGVVMILTLINNQIAQERVFYG